MISTYTIIARNMKCPNDCPVCISKMTPSNGINYDDSKFNWDKFDKANQIAISRGAQNVIITGKGEPTLFPDLISGILTELPKNKFERIELQTEGSNIFKYILDSTLQGWRNRGLDLIAISIYFYDEPNKNAKGFPISNALFKN